MKVAFVIPCYQHSQTLNQVLSTILKLGMFTIDDLSKATGDPKIVPTIFVVDDGSDEFHQEQILATCQRYPQVRLIQHQQNLGKGGAVKTGLKAARASGYTHAAQIDSDGQHDLNKIDELLALARQHPGDLISGRPIYDNSVPKSRLYGRYATHIWVWIETLSFRLEDSMCGFRVYPLIPTCQILENVKVGNRMDFDIEIMVRLYWGGVSCHFIPVQVSYPKGGLSHFKLWQDNWLITQMHTRLFFGMLWRWPIIIKRSLSAPSSNAPPPENKKQSWFQTKELGTQWGLQIVLAFYHILGRRLLNLVLYPIAFYYANSQRRVRAASENFRSQLLAFSGSRSPEFSTYDHVFSFANMMMDKLAVWMGDIKYSDLNEEDVKKLLEIHSSEQGAFFITSHFGNIEVCRCLGRFTNVRYNALVYYENAQRFNDLIKKINPASNLNLISVKNVGPDLAIDLKERVDRGEWIFVMGDRHSIQENQRTIDISFLGKETQLPEGPFLLAYLLEVPIYTIHCYRDNNTFRINTSPLPVNFEKSRANRSLIVKSLCEKYIKELETLVVQHPQQWFNFFNFWSPLK